ncbi:MAG: hypothetical protein ABJQ34_02930 [Paracoccaceae bacterium]
MRIHLLIFVLFLLPNFALSHENNSLPIETRFGPLEEGVEVSCDRQGDVCIDLQSMIFQNESVWSQSILPNILRLIEWGPDKDILLFELWSGGASCCTSYRFLTVGADGSHFSEEFAKHALNPKEFVVNEAEISFRLERDYPANIDHLLATFDGDSVEIETIYEDDTDSEIAGAGDDVSRWLGDHPSSFWEDGAERNRFRQIIGDYALNCLRTSTSGIASNFELKEGYMVSSGMWPHQGGSRHGYIAVEVETGRPFAVQMWGDRQYYFGAIRDAFPDVLQNWIQQDVLRLRTRPVQLFGDRKVEPEYINFCS